MTICVRSGGDLEVQGDVHVWHGLQVFDPVPLALAGRRQARCLSPKGLLSLLITFIAFRFNSHVSLILATRGGAN